MRSLISKLLTFLNKTLQKSQIAQKMTKSCLF